MQFTLAKASEKHESHRKKQEEHSASAPPPAPVPPSKDSGVTDDVIIYSAASPCQCPGSGHLLVSRPERVVRGAADGNSRATLPTRLAPHYLSQPQFPQLADFFLYLRAGFTPRSSG